MLRPFYVIVESEDCKESVVEILKKRAGLSDVEIAKIEFKEATARDKKGVLPKIWTTKQNYGGWGAVEDFALFLKNEIEAEREEQLAFLAQGDVRRYFQTIPQVSRPELVRRLRERADHLELEYTVDKDLKRNLRAA